MRIVILILFNFLGKSESFTNMKESILNLCEILSEIALHLLITEGNITGLSHVPRSGIKQQVAQFFVHA